MISNFPAGTCQCTSQLGQVNRVKLVCEVFHDLILKVDCCWQPCSKLLILISWYKNHKTFNWYIEQHIADICNSTRQHFSQRFSFPKAAILERFHQLLPWLQYIWCISSQPFQSPSVLMDVCLWTYIWAI